MVESAVLLSPLVSLILIVNERFLVAWMRWLLDQSCGCTSLWARKFCHKLALLKRGFWNILLVTCGGAGVVRDWWWGH